MAIELSFRPITRLCILHMAFENAKTRPWHTGAMFSISWLVERRACLADNHLLVAC